MNRGKISCVTELTRLKRCGLKNKYCVYSTSGVDHGNESSYVAPCNTFCLSLFLRIWSPSNGEYLANLSSSARRAVESTLGFYSRGFYIEDFTFSSYQTG